MKNILSEKIMVLIFISLFFWGCKDFWHPEGSKKENNNDSKKIIAVELRGKWELQSLYVSGSWYNLPITIGSNILYSAGYEYSSNSYLYFENGILVEQNTGIYTEGNRIYLSNGQVSQLSWQVSGNKLTLTNTVIGNVFIYQKTSKFFWE